MQCKIIMLLKYRLKQLFCKHDYRLWANVYGDLINEMNCRTVMLCPRCGKRKYVGEYIEAPCNFNSIIGLLSDYTLPVNSVIKNEDQFLSIFGDML